MKIGILLNDSGIENMDLSCPNEGNPGVGGTLYCFLMLIYYLRLFDDIQLTVFHYNDNVLPPAFQSCKVRNAEECVALCQTMHLSFLVHEQMSPVEEWISLLQKYKVQSVLWAHNYLFLQEMREIPKCEPIKRVVFVGREQYDSYMDHPIIKRSTFIYNFCEDRKMSGVMHNTKSHTVVYVGSLVEMKGFHILAKEWKHILKKVPDARLLVLGSGRLYDRKQKLGSYGIAEAAYEKKFIKYLTNQEGKILDSVSFEGIVGQGKETFFSEASVGVVNPSAKSETFCLSAVEMELAGLPVIAGGKYGLFDTVKDKKTGYLIGNGRELRKRILELLLDSEKNENMGKYGRIFAREKFDSQKIAEQWHTLFCEMESEKECCYIAPSGNWRNDKKWLRKISRMLGGFGISQIERELKRTILKVFHRGGWRNA